MKTISRFVLIASMALPVLLSCEKEKHGADVGEGSISVVAHVNVETKAGYEGTSVLPQTFVMNIDQEGTKYDYSAVTMTKGNAAVYSAPEGTELLWASESRTGVTAKAMTVPYGVSSFDAANSMTVSVMTDQTVAANVLASDLLGTATASGITVSDNEVKVGFNHLMSKLSVTYTVGEEFSSNAVTINSISLNNVCTAGGYSYASMNYDSSVAKSYGNVSMLHDASGKTAEAIFYPYVPTEVPTLAINVTIDGTAATLSCPVTLTDATAGFVGGNRYKMNVSIVGTTVSGTTATIAVGWGAATSQGFVTE